MFAYICRALDLSVRVLLERTQQLYQEIGRLQRALNEARSQPREEIVETFRERMEMEMSRFVYNNYFSKFHKTSLWIERIKSRYIKYIKMPVILYI